MMTEMVLVQKAVSKIFGDFVSKVVSDGVDVLKGAIKDADLDRKSYNQNLQTKMYQMMIDALNRFTHNTYSKQDELYDAAESILKGFISTKDSTDAVKSGLKMLGSDVNDVTCQEFLEILCGEICKDNNSDLYKEIDMLWKREESKYIYGEFAKIDRNDREVFGKLNDLKEVLDFIKENMNGQREDKTEHYKSPIVNRADEYADKWNENVFLNDFNEEDENAGIEIKLSELYIEKCLPHYIWKTNTNPSDKLRNLLKKYVIDKNDRKMLLILGQAGIGKSTLITWIMANFEEKEDDILVYQFANDLGGINWQNENVLNDIFKVIGLEYDELENKTLILDGFDEIYTGGERERILNKLEQELKRRNILKKFSLIITCRENYIYNIQNIECDYITLQVWDEIQIVTFCRTYWEKCGNKISEDKIQKILKNKEIFGIPLILYMILALNISIEKSCSIVDIHDQIFSLEKGAIYNRCYDLEHRINDPEIKEHIYRISQKMAFWIFENNADKAFISQQKFEVICDNEMREYGKKNKDIKSDALIGNFFKLKYCEGKGTDELQFVHRSIYEYFVVTFFFESLHKLKTKKDVAGKLGELLKRGHLSKQILEFIKYKFDSLKEFNLSNITKEVFNMMLRNGMTFYTKEKYNNVIAQERNIFSNMLEVVGLWNLELEEIDYEIISYLQCNRQSELNLKGIKLAAKEYNFLIQFWELMYGENLCRVYLREANLSKADLSGTVLSGADLGVAILNEAYLEKALLDGVNLVGAHLRKANLADSSLKKADLREADLRGVNLSGADLSGANLSRADLSGANLSRADLSGANLSRADLSGANLSRADLSGADLSGTNLNGSIFNEKQVNILYEKYDLSNSRVLLSEENKTISYQEYCIRKQQVK